MLGAVLALSPASAFSSGVALQHSAERAANSLLQRVRVICRVYTTGNVRHTEYCEDGYTCDLANRKCAPGPEMQRRMEARRQAEQQQQARQEYKASALRRNEESRLVAARTTGARTSATTGSAAASSGQQSGNCNYLGGGYTCVTYYWNGNPKEIPSPHYSSGSGASTIARGVRAQRVSQRLQQQNHVPQNVAQQIGNLLALWQDLQPGDPNRQTISDQVQRLAKCCDIPITPDDYSDKKAARCGIPTVQMKGALSALQLQWTPWDLSERAVETHVCTAGDGLDDCVSQHYGELVMDVEPGIAAFCRQQEINTPIAQYDDALKTCARNKFDNAWDYLAGLAFMWQSASELDPGHKCSDAQRAKHESLRDKLKRLLAAKEKGGRGPKPPSDNQDNGKPDAAADKISDVEVALPADRPTANPDDDVLCAYLARWAVRGKLTVDGTAQLPPECQAYIAPATDCARENCQMAKVIDDAEQQAARQSPPWGADDSQSADEIMNNFATGNP